jgi:drug/metabolite transporter (DMT)-like permease
MLINLSLVFVQILFAINYSTNKVVMHKLSPFLWANIRFLSAGLLLMALSFALKKKHPPVSSGFVFRLIGLSMLGIGLGLGLFLEGLNRTTTINGAVITSLVPLLTLMIEFLRGVKKLSLFSVAGFALSMIGVYFIIGFTNISLGADTFYGDVLVFLAAISWAVFYNYGKPFLMKYDFYWITSWMFVISGLFFTLVNVGEWQNFVIPSYTDIDLACAIFTIIGATVMAYTLNNWTLKNSSSSKVALFMYLQPVIAVFIGWFFLNERITTFTGIGILLALGGMFLASYERLPNKLKGS